MGARLLFSAMKNEGPFLLEWVAYHRAIGFDRIVVVSNDCDDGTDDLLDALAGAGVVEHFSQTVPEGVSAQRNAAELVMGRGLLAADDWVIWLDADEFLNVHVGECKIDDLIAAVGECRGVLIPWRLFGDGGNARFPGRFVSEHFVHAANADFEPNREVKTLFRVGDGVRGFARRGIHRPLIARDSGLGPETFLGANGRTLDPVSKRNERWLAGVDLARTGPVGLSEFGWELAQINHYCVRTPEFFALKLRRGRGWKAGVVNDRHTPEFYDRMNRNDAEDRTILRHAEATEKGIAALLEHPAVAAAAAEVARRGTQENGVPPEPAAAPVAAAPKQPHLTLPPAEADLLRAVYHDTRAILEYGSGGSTTVAGAIEGADVFSVESDRAWADDMEAWFAANPAAARVRIHHADIGPTKAWGRPAKSRSFRSWPGYALSVWDRPDFVQPDVVLIDGRFRLACFLTTLIRTRKPVTVLWDDYTDRPGYHAAERLVAPSGFAGRMARFQIAPLPFPPEHLGLLANSFLDPE